MLTLFTSPKPFRGQADVAQRNALLSWTRLSPRPEIVLLDDVEGAAAVASDLGLRHIRDLERNANGTPLVRSIFSAARIAARHPVLCYANADIILLQDVVEAARRVSELVPSDFLLVARRLDCNLDEPLDFSKPEWEKALRAYVATHGRLESAAATDCFIFRRETDWNIPPFAIGRSAWDGWFIYNALMKRIPVIDGSDSFLVLHQHHGYSHLERRSKPALKNPEIIENQRLRGSFLRQCTIADATHVLSDGTLAVPSWRNRVIANSLRLRMWATYHMQGPWYPYSIPLIGAYRIGKKVTSAITRLRSRQAVVHLPHGTRP